jgi:hypothetical protein
MSAIGKSLVALLLVVPLLKADDDAPALFQNREHFINAIATNLQVDCVATPTELTGNHDVVMTLTIRGATNPHRIRRPQLADRVAWKALFQQITNGDDAPAQPGDPAVSFTYRLRPRTTGPVTIPAIQLDYFTPSAAAGRQIRTKYTEPIPLIVRAEPAPPRPEPELENVLVSRTPFVPSEPTRLHWIALLVGLIVLLMSWVLLWRWQHPEGVRLARHRRNRAMRRLLDALDHAGPTPAVATSKAVRGYLVERHGLDVTATVPSEMVANLQSRLAPKRVAELMQLLTLCDAARFDGTIPSSVAESLPATARQMVLAWEEHPE